MKRLLVLALLLVMPGCAGTDLFRGPEDSPTYTDARVTGSCSNFAVKNTGGEEWPNAMVSFRGHVIQVWLGGTPGDRAKSEGYTTFYWGNLPAGAAVGDGVVVGKPTHFGAWGGEIEFPPGRTESSEVTVPEGIRLRRC